MRNLILLVTISMIALSATEVSAQSIHDHNRFHGASPTLQPNLPAGVEGLFLEFRWRNQANADVDGHVQLPAGFGPYAVTQTINFSRNDQPFANGPQNRRVYPSQQGVRFNNGAAFAFQSGDQGGAAPQGVGCVEPNGGSCEFISITGNVPTAQYGVGIHNFNFFNITNSAADYDIIVYATNGVASIEGHESHLASNTVSGTGLTTGQSRLETVNYEFTGNSPHAIGVPELISTLGHSVSTDRIQNMHQVVAPLKTQNLVQAQIQEFNETLFSYDTAGINSFVSEYDYMRVGYDIVQRRNMLQATRYPKKVLGLSGQLQKGWLGEALNLPLPDTNLDKFDMTSYEIFEKNYKGDLRGMIKPGGKQAHATYNEMAKGQKVFKYIDVGMNVLDFGINAYEGKQIVDSGHGSILGQTSSTIAKTGYDVVLGGATAVVDIGAQSLGFENVAVGDTVDGMFELADKNYRDHKIDIAIQKNVNDGTLDCVLDRHSCGMSGNNIFSDAHAWVGHKAWIMSNILNAED